MESEGLFEDVKDEIEKVPAVLDTSDEDVQDETKGPLINKGYHSLFKRDGKGVLLRGYIQSIFQDIESYLRTRVDLAEDDIRLILKQYNLNFLTYEIPPGVYTTRDNINYFNKISKGGIQLEYDDITVKTKLLERSEIVRFDDKSFFSIPLGFSPKWDYKTNIENSSQKIKK